MPVASVCVSRVTLLESSEIFTLALATPTLRIRDVASIASCLAASNSGPAAPH